MSDRLSSNSSRILVIDDNPSIHEDFRKILLPAQQASDELSEAEALLFGAKPDAGTESTVQFDVDSAFQGQEGLARVEQAQQEGRSYAMAFVDVRMPPGWDGIETISRIWQVYPELQVVICTAYSDYSWNDIIQNVGNLGNTDSLVILKKPFDNVEVLQLAHALTSKWHLTQQAKDRLQELDRKVNERTQELQATNARLQEEIAERERVDAELRLSQERFSKAFRATPIPMAIQTVSEERYLHVNEAFVKTLGYPPEEIVGRTDEELGLWQDPKPGAKISSRLKQLGSIRNAPCQLKSKSGQARSVFLSAELLNLGGEPNMLVIAEDVSEREQLEKRLQESQKMEAVGQLAAGIAHDFNNILTIIQGHVNLQLAQADLAAPLRSSLKHVNRASERAADLTRQLLAFSSKQVVQSRVLSVNQIVRQLHALFCRVIGEQVTLHCECAETLPAIEADECNLEQVIMNLVVNARDAMPQGGQLVVRTRVVDIDEAYAAQNPQSRPGQFVCLSVADEGCGIAPANLEHIFEPFYTTKDLGKGTGLGLSTAFGIVKQHAGWIEVSSEVGKGSTFSVYLPKTEKPLILEDEPTRLLRNVTGQERVLLVEDEELLREMQREVLQQHGYRVVEASDAVQALNLWKEHGQDFDIVVTDVVMPNGISGLQLGKQLQQSKPGVKLIYTSGYNSELAGRDFAANQGCAYLQKPYKPERLLHTVRELLGQIEVVAADAREPAPPDRQWAA